MTEPQEASPQSLLASLRSEGASRLDPARFHYLEVLAGRLATQPGPVQLLLQQKLAAGLAEYAQRWSVQVQSRAGAAGDAPRPRRVAANKAAPRASCPPLAQLNEYIRTATRPADSQHHDAERDVRELASVRRFRQAWASSRTLEQVERAAARKPQKAGPINSHMLVLQSLQLMQDLSAEYLRHFVVHVESLQWLEDARERSAAQPPARARPSRAAKTASPSRRGSAKK